MASLNRAAMARATDRLMTSSSARCVAESDAVLRRRRTSSLRQISSKRSWSTRANGLMRTQVASWMPGGKTRGFHVKLMFVIRLADQLTDFRQHSGMCRVGARPRWQQLHERAENPQRQEQDKNRWQQPFSRGKPHLVCGVAEEALGKELPADDDVPAHRKDADQRQDASGDIDADARAIAQPKQLRQAEQPDRDQRAEADLQHDLRREQPGLDHEVQRPERFV